MVAGAHAPADQLPMGGRHQHAARGQDPVEQLDEAVPRGCVDVGEERADPDQVVVVVEQVRTRLGHRVDRFRPEGRRAEVHAVVEQVAPGEPGVGERGREPPQHPAVTAGEVEDVGRLGGVGGEQGQPHGLEGGLPGGEVPGQIIGRHLLGGLSVGSTGRRVAANPSGRSPSAVVARGSVAIAAMLPSGRPAGG